MVVFFALLMALVVVFFALQLAFVVAFNALLIELMAINGKIHGRLIAFTAN